jgi:betaine-aldehyde dehydrogenase
MPHQSSIASRTEPDAGRRRQLVETTIEVLAEFGYVGTILSRIGSRAGVSRLVAHYFGDKDALLDAAFRMLVGQVRVRERLSR